MAAIETMICALTRYPRAAVASATLVAAACSTGAIGGPGVQPTANNAMGGSGQTSGSSLPSGAGATSGSGAVAGATTGAGAASGVATTGPQCSGINPGRAPLRRLDQYEYNNTIHDLLGETTPYADQFPPDEHAGGFTNDAEVMLVSHLLAEGYESAAEKMAMSAVTRLSSLYTCNVAVSGEDACAKQFITTFGKRAFRRPLTADEQSRFYALYATGRTGGAFQDGVEVVVEMMLQSPYFVYRVETPALGQADAGAMPATPVTPYELATRLSYFIWGSMPDDALFAAADANALATPAQIGSQVARMMQDPRAHQSVATFHREWLELANALQAPKSAMLYPSWSPQLANDLYGESSTFVEQVYWNDGSLAALLSAPYTYANQSVATYYGVTGPTGTAFTKLALDPTQRAGILTQGTFLAAQANPDQTSPVRRGKFIREQLLCQQVAPPPPNIMVMPPMVDPTKSTRDRFRQHELTGSICAACHTLMDPLGFGFEHYDAVGQWRTIDGPSAVDATGTLAGTDVDGPYDGAVALVTKLSASSDVANCVATRWFEYATGRTNDVADICTLQSIQQAFAASRDMRTLPAAIAASDAFRYRPVPGAGP